VQPILPADCHEHLQPENDLELIFSQRVSRTLSKDLHFQFKRVVYKTNHPWRTYGQMINGKPVQVPD